MFHCALFIVLMKPEVDAKLAKLRQYVFQFRNVWKSLWRLKTEKSHLAWD